MKKVGDIRVGFRVTSCLFVCEAQQMVSERGGGEMDFVAINFLLIKKKKQTNWQVREECLLSKSRPLANKPVFLTIFFQLMLGSPTQFICFWRDSLQWGRASSFTRFLDHT
jgi:hypothetical protein